MYISVYKQNTETEIIFLASRLGGDFSKFFDKFALNRIAVDSGFKQRNSKFKPWMFVETMLFHGFTHKEVCLNDLASDISNRYDVEISKQGVDSRFNLSSVKMVKMLLSKMVNQFKQIHKIDETFNQFRTIRIKDSTGFDLPDNLSEFFRVTE